MQTITIGGNRLGSGKKMLTAINDYARSNHNLDTKFTASIGCGLIYPCLGLIGNRGDTFTIGLKAAARTLPTMGPLFGSFKLQVDLFQCDMRLYQALLHNNPMAIGLQMNQVKWPKITVKTGKSDYDKYAPRWGEFSKSCLQKYLGMSGIGVPISDGQTTFQRSYFGIPTLAYYDVFKNYYANKQEGKGYVVVPNAQKAGFKNYNGIQWWRTEPIAGETNEEIYNTTTNTTIAGAFDKYLLCTDNIKENCICIEVKYTDIENTEHTETTFLDGSDFSEVFSLIEKDGHKFINLETTKDDFADIISNYADVEVDKTKIITFKLFTRYVAHGEYPLEPEDIELTDKHGIKLEEFDLKTIDDMRYSILTSHTLGSSFYINSVNKLPYNANFGYIDELAGGTETKNKCEHVGLVTKCYQNDIFNNWLRREWIEGENSIAEVTKIAVNDGAFKIDSLILGEAIYNMLNRIALSDATYYSWLNVTYTDNGARHIESPIYVGGLSGEVLFEEIVQTAPADGDPLGTLGGRGILREGKGGHVVIKCSEPCFILGLVSLTPRIMYTQGNEWYNTELDSIDDLHKPALDAIAFQNLMGEQLAWWDTQLSSDGATKIRRVIGKLPAWINYCTNFDRAFGDMAGEEGAGYMILNRNYEMDESDGTIKDATSYIDPTKYNYAFAYTGLDSQNFWMQILFDIKERWLGSAHQIPNA